MSERDLPNMDDVELPDIPDDEELDSPDGAESADSEADEAADASEGGRFGALFAKLAPILDRLGALTAPVAKLCEPVGKALAPVAKVAAPVAAIVAPLLARVPRPILAGAGSFAGVLVVVVLLAAVLGGGQGGAEASTTATKAAPVKSTAPLAPVATPKPAYTPTPPAPTATPTPAVWEERGPIVISRGIAPLPKPMHALNREFLRLIEDPRETYTIVTRTQVVMSGGPMSPWWGIVLAYQDETHHIHLQFTTDSYAKNQPQVGLVLANGATARPVGLSSPLPDLPFWGRDLHEIRVEVNPDEVVVIFNGQFVKNWPNPRTFPSTTKGLFVNGPSRVRFESFTVE